MSARRSAWTALQGSYACSCVHRSIPERVRCSPGVVEEGSFLSPVVIAGEELGQLPWIVGPSDNVVGEAPMPATAVEGRLLLNALSRKVKGTTVCALRVH